jgi:hypothetical protein
MFEANSRYANLETYAVTDRRGRLVAVVPVPSRPDQELLGIHALRQGERSDHLAARYLNDPAGYWRIAEQNDCMLAESLSEAPEIEIPAQSR